MHCLTIIVSACLMGLVMANPNAKMVFASTDKNNDNQLSREELRALFRKLDTDKNGRLTKREFEGDFQKNSVGTVAEADKLFDAGAQGDQEIKVERVGSFYRFFDTNNDGNVEREEFTTKWNSLG